MKKKLTDVCSGAQTNKQAEIKFPSPAKQKQFLALVTALTSARMATTKCATLRAIIWPRKESGKPS